MNISYFVFLWLGILAIGSTYVDYTREEAVAGRVVRRWNLIMAAVAFAPVFYMAVFTSARADTGAYLLGYHNLEKTIADIPAIVMNRESGFGFEIFSILVKSVFGDDEVPFRLIIALIHSIPILFVCRKYSENYLITLFLFLATGCHLAWMMNGLRQYIAVSLIVAGTPFLIRKNYLPIIALTLIAASIHTSAILMIPVIFIVTGKPWNIKTLLFIAITIVMMYFFTKDATLLDQMLVETEYANTMANAIQNGDDGTNPIRVLVSSVPMLMALWGRRYLETEDDSVINICINMSIITSGLYLVSMVTSGIMLGRLPIYTALYTYILMPALIPRIFDERSARLVKYMMIILFFAYYWYAYRSY